MKFNEWLVQKKEFSEKGSHDAASRVKRVCTILGTSEIPMDALEKLEQSSDFKALPMCVKSQLRRSSKLYLEYLAEK